MSQRGYKIPLMKPDYSKATFSLAMDWEALEPYVINGEFGIDHFEGSCDTMVINVGKIKEDIKNKVPHAMKFLNILNRIVKESERDIVLYDIG